MKRSVLIALLLTSGCDMLRKDADYAAELEVCLQSTSTCEEYVACRKAVSEKYGRPFDGSCDEKGEPMPEEMK